MKLIKKVTKFHLNVFAIFLERTTVEKEERDYAKQGNNRLPCITTILIQ